MKVKIGEYEIEIKAKRPDNKTFNSMDTMIFLNELVLIYSDAFVRKDMDGYQAIANDYRNKQKDIYDTLASQGFYKNF